MGDDDVAARAAGRPPWSVRVAVAVLLGSLVVGIVLLVAAQVTGQPDAARSLFDVVVRAVAGIALSRLLWQGSRSARLIVLIVAVINLVVLGVTLPVTPTLVLVRSIVSVVFLTTVIGALSTPSARQWCQSGKLDHTAQDAAARRRHQRAHLPIARRLVQALRDDRNARG